LQFCFENHVLDSNLRELRRDGEPILLQPQVFDLLLYLVERRGSVVSKRDLIDHVWRERSVSDSTLNSRISAVRKAIGDDGQTQRLIRTIPRKGFRFVGHVLEQMARVTPLGARPALVRATLDRPAIAVLAFENMSDDPEQDYFCDAISENILTALSRVRWFLVISRSSSFIYKGRAVHIREIAEELGVRYVVEGSVQKAENRVRITVQLNDATTCSHVWAEYYDRELDDLFMVQDDIAKAIVAAIEPQIYAAENSCAHRKEPDSMDAWDFLMRALSHFWRMTRQDHMIAQKLLERAIAIDPGYNRALSLLATCQMCGVHLGWVDLAKVASDAERAAMMAVKGDHEDAWAHTALGIVYFSTRRLDDALSSLERALSLNPCFSLAQAYCALALCCTGKSEDAFEATQWAIRSNPRDPALAIHYGFAAYARFAEGDYTEAVALSREAIRHRSDLTCAYRVLTTSAGMTGDTALAAMALEELRRTQPNVSLAWIAAELPWSSDADLDHYMEGFRKAGLS